MGNKKNLNTTMTLKEIQKEARIEFEYNFGSENFKKTNLYRDILFLLDRFIEKSARESERAILTGDKDFFE